MLDLDDQVAAREGLHRAEEEGPLPAEAGDHVFAGIKVVEFVRPEHRVDELALLSPRLGNYVDLGDKRAVHRHRALAQLEGGILLKGQNTVSDVWGRPAQTCGGRGITAGPPS